MKYSQIKFIKHNSDDLIINSDVVEKIAVSLPNSFKLQDLESKFFHFAKNDTARAADKLLQRMRKAGFIQYNSKTKTWSRIPQSEVK